MRAPQGEGRNPSMGTPARMSIPKTKKDQLALVPVWSLRRPGSDDPGGLGAEESETERTEPTQ